MDLAFENLHLFQPYLYQFNVGNILNIRLLEAAIVYGIPGMVWLGLPWLKNPFLGSQKPLFSKGWCYAVPNQSMYT